MVQIGNIHIGKKENAVSTASDVAEVSALWNELVARYDIIEFTQIMQNFTHDIDLKFILTKGLSDTLELQVNKLEEEMNKLQIPLPGRPPKSVNTPSTTSLLEDKHIFILVFTGIQNMLIGHMKHIQAMTTTDSLRKMFIEFLNQELNLFDKMVLYGKIKGWLRSPPKYTP